jgi:putative nucleotidyltransferase with HDIG domain
VGGHAAQVAAYAVAIAQEMGLPTEQIETVRQSGYLHDIGKLAIPEIILHKPEQLTDNEYSFLKGHSDIGADLVATSQGLRHLAPFIRHHHERWDGKGYPLGLAGTAIPLEARILCACDAIEAMASDRPYHHALSSDDIVAELQRCAGLQFESEVVDAFIRVVRREGALYIVNSARTVASQHIGSVLDNANLAASMFARIYATGDAAAVVQDAAAVVQDAAAVQQDATG